MMNRGIISEAKVTESVLGVLSYGYSNSIIKSHYSERMLFEILSEITPLIPIHIV